MILPIIAYGDPVLKRKALPISESYEGLEQLIESMWETMYHAHGVGLAAPQIGKSIRLFVIDGSPFADDEDATPSDQLVLKTFKKVFINAEMITEEGDDFSFTEGCLSIPDIREDVTRPSVIRLRYLDENFIEHVEEYSGLAARIIQHEYDHIEGILFTDKLSPLKKRLIKGRLDKISRGMVESDYRMKFYTKSKKR
ncbi:MAG: peptide deformylase [Flavobacteriaceae bacterium]